MELSLYLMKKFPFQSKSYHPSWVPQVLVFASILSNIMISVFQVLSGLPRSEVTDILHRNITGDSLQDETEQLQRQMIF